MPKSRSTRQPVQPAPTIPPQADTHRNEKPSTGAAASPFAGFGQNNNNNNAAQPAASPFAGFGQNTQTQQSTPSLFGATQNNQQAPTSNLFGGGNTTQTQQNTTSNLFGGTANNSQNQQSTSSLFGATTNNAAAQPASTGGLFGSTPAAAQPAQQNSGPSAFSGFGQAKPAATTTTPSLFGNTAQQPAQSNTGGSLFGVTTAQPQPAQSSGSLFGGLGLGASTAQPQQQTGSLFGNTTQTAQAPAQAQPQNGQLAPTSTNAHFQTLLERGKKRREPAAGGLEFGELPTLQLGLGDIASKVRHLGGSGSFSKAGRTQDSKAHYLLAASGVPRGATVRDLNAFSIAAASPITPAPAPFEANIDNYITNLRAKSTQDLIDEAMEQSRREFDTFLEDNIQINYDEQRQRIFEHFGLAKPREQAPEAGNGSIGPGSRGAFGRSTRRTKGPAGAEQLQSRVSFGASRLSKSVLGGSVSRGSMRASLFTDVAEQTAAVDTTLAPEDPMLRSKQEKYASKVKELNSARLQEVCYPLVEEFGRVETEAGGDTPEHLIEAYRALKHIVKEDPSAQRPSDSNAVRERQYAKSYLEDNPGKSVALRKQILDGSRSYLEESFLANVDKFVAANPREANLGGVPSKVNKVRAYLRIKAGRKDLGTENVELQMLGEDYCWALIFYLLRAGLVEEAAQYVAENERAIKSMDRHFTQYMAAFARDPERRLPRDMQGRINAEYQQRLRLAPENSIDPYRMACYKIVGRCDLSRKVLEGVSTTLEDWVWLTVSLAREVTRADEAAGEYYGLEDVRSTVEEIGQRHFSAPSDNSSGYATFFYLQILVGMFEKAVSYLYPHNYVAAVHFAIALDFYGLLRVADFYTSEEKLLTFTTSGQPQINFGRLLGYYTRDFRIARAEAATDYLTLICLNSDLPGAVGQSQVSVCHEALKELVLETREFALLLGDIHADGTRIKGAIEQRVSLINLKDQDEFLRTLTIQAAAVADDSGRITDAVLLYHLAEEYDNVILIINRALSDAIAVDLSQDQMRLQPLKPRQPDQQQSQQQQNQPETSLSLTSVDDPTTLARNMITLYNSTALYFRKIRPANRDACGLLLRISTAKSLVAAQSYSAALDTIATLELLPLRASGNVSVIRSAAQAFNALPQVVARNVGNLLLWSIMCLGKQREAIRAKGFRAGSDEQAVEGLLQAAKDLMVFAGLIRYKLSPEVMDVLARAGQMVEGF